MAPYVAWLIILSVLCFGIVSSRNNYDRMGRDLATFVTRPDLRPPLINITTYLPDHITPGYWFCTPYDYLQSQRPSVLFYPGQIGPTILDSNGELVWSGANVYDEYGVTDFKVVSYKGTQHLSFIEASAYNDGNMFDGAGIILNQSYSIQTRVRMNGGDGGFNMHEFQVLDDGKTALAQTMGRRLVNFEDYGFGPQVGFLSESMFREINLETGEKIFEWHSLDHVSPNASYRTKPTTKTPWDYFHLNSVDKNREGDYLISSRYTSCIYKISGKDGSIMWRLGGNASDFSFNGFNFSSQHHARFRQENSTTTIISFLNNAADESHSTANRSSAYLVALDIPTMTASLIRSWDRPDGELTRARGTVQFLPDTNVVVGWSSDVSHGYVSEFTYDGELVQELKFASKRFVDYRTYKYNFTGYPIEPPAIKGFAYGTSNSTVISVFYVSWNGATEVKLWKFYDAASSAVLGVASKSGFETMHMVAGYSKWVFVEALAADGQVLGRSAMAETIVPSNWWVDENGSVAASEAVIPHFDTNISDQIPGNVASITNSCSVQGHDKILSIGGLLLVAVLSGVMLTVLLMIHSFIQQRGLQLCTKFQ